MNRLPQVFTYGEKQVRTIIENGEVLFVGKDVCDVLEIKNSRDALSRLDEDEKGVVLTDTPGGKQQMLCVNEAGLYALILSSRKPEAKQFKRWITHEVLPSIRKHGAYMTDDVLERSIQDPDYMIGLLTALKEERQKRLEAEKTVNILMHVNKTYTATEIAKELGFKSAQQLNKDLERRKIQYNQNGTWVLFSQYADKGYVEIKQEVLDNGKVIYHRRFTQRGREFLLKLYGVQDNETA
jgi:anti-repressor protein